jgi:2,4-dienoyl-CoA reductase-like NADH-dependent reductase (Old Yellow Enzyme family)
VGMIISGHLFIHPSGKAHPEMTGIYDDGLVPYLAALTDAVHAEGGTVVAQINHGGMHANGENVAEHLAPSAVAGSLVEQPARALTGGEIEMLVQAFGEAARRAREAGFDGVQIHGAHGYLISQFLSPYINRRDDAWGGDPGRRANFLRGVCRAVRERVGPDYPVIIKFGMADGVDGGLTLDESVRIVAAMEEMELDGVEVSSGVGGSSIRPDPKEPYFRPFARAARQATSLPILLVGGLRTRDQMEDVLGSGDADLISLCRPLICEPDLPNRLREGLQERAICISGDRCWPDEMGEGIRCKCVKANRDKERARS